MPDQQTTARDTAVVDAPERDASSDDLLGAEAELPRRPRRRLLAPVPLALLGVLAVACGFIAGVLVEKGQSSGTSGSAAAGAFASRLSALRSGAGGAGAAGGDASRAAAERTARTAGQVAYMQGSTLYVTTAEGDTVKVKTSAATSVNKTVQTTVASIHPGETVTVTGTAGSSGAVSAETIGVGPGASPLASLFGGGSGSGGGSGAGGRSAGGAPELFGKGG
jgi:hypothetical protein